MPSIVHANITAPTYLRLTDTIEVQESTNGFFSVKVKFIAKSSDRAMVFPQFYMDAPPPIWPNVVDQNTLQSKQLYMLTHNYVFSNGLMNIDATYVGVQSRFIKAKNGFVVTKITKEGPFNKEIVGKEQTIQATSLPDATGKTTTLSFTWAPTAQTQWNRYVYEFEYAAISGLPEPEITNVTFDKLVEILFNRSFLYEFNPLWVNNPKKEEFVRQIWWGQSNKEYGLLDPSRIANERDVTDITPTVKIIKSKVYSYDPPAYINVNI